MPNHGSNVLCAVQPCIMVWTHCQLQLAQMYMLVVSAVVFGISAVLRHMLHPLVTICCLRFSPLDFDVAIVKMGIFSLMG